MKCPHCPVESGLDCVGERHPPACRDVEAGRPGRAAQLVRIAGARIPRRVGAASPSSAPGGPALVARGHVNSFTGYGQHLERLAREVEAAGWPVAIDPASVDGSLLPVSDWAASRLLGAPHAGPRLVTMTPDAPVGPGDVALTMWESTRIDPAWAANLDRAACVAVPCRWNLDGFRASGVAAPMRVVPLGYDPGAFAPGPGRPDGPARFGASARTAHGGVRKGLAGVVAAFRLAFPDDPDARLEVKVWPDCRVDDPGDPRIRIIKQAWDEARLAAWYRSLSAFVSLSKGEGWGLQPLQAMACGTPCILPIHGGHAEYATPGDSYPVEFDEAPVPAGTPIYGGLGSWCEPSVGSAAARMRQVAADPAGASAIGRAAAIRALGFTWARSGAALMAVLREFGLLPAAPPPARPSVAEVRAIQTRVRACPHRTAPACGCPQEPGSCAIGRGRGGVAGAGGGVTADDCYRCIEAGGPS